MPDQNPLPPQSKRTPPPAAALAGTAAYWLSLDDDDVALGCECADPALQIERWGQEALPLVDHSA